MKKKLSVFISIVISIFFLYLAFKNVPFEELFLYFKQINYLWVIPSFFIIFLSFVVRAIRWQMILNLSSSQKVNFSTVYHLIFASFMMNSILPARAGELFRPSYLKKKYNFSFPSVLSTVLVERFFDIANLFILFIVALYFLDIEKIPSFSFRNYQIDASFLVQLALGLFKIIIILLFFMLFLGNKKMRDFIIKIVVKTEAVFFFLKENWRKKIVNFIVDMINSIGEGFSVLKSVKDIIICELLSVSVWVLAILSYFVMVFAFPSINLSFFETGIYVVILCLFITLPSVPGYWGIWEVGGVLALFLFNVPQKEALAFTLINHFVQFFPVIILGAFSTFYLGAKIKEKN